MKLITEIKLDQELEVITEGGPEGKRDFYIKGIFMQAEAQNKNGRIYPHHVLAREVQRYNEEIVKTGRAMGELGHPEGPTINLERVSHLIKDLKEDGSNFVGKAKLLENTPYGKIARALVEEGVRLGVSSRGMGSLIPRRDGIQEVQEDFTLCTVDIVADPSAPNAFVNGIMEGKEWVWENGVIKEMHIEQYKKEIQKAKLKQLEDVKLRAWDDFFKKLSGK